MIPAAFAPIGNHLWQSTLFAGVAGLLTLALRRNQARVRYWIWLAASYKFLLPFSWVVSIGRLFQWRMAPAIMPPAFSAVTDAFSQPFFLTTIPSSVHASSHLSAIVAVIWAIWACGFVAVAAGWAREWLRLRAIVRAASPLRLGMPATKSAICHSEEQRDEESLLLSSGPGQILRSAQNDNRRPLLQCPLRIVSTAARLEPGVVGVFRPVLLLPEGIAARLTQAQLQAVIAHELCHVRRRDNLTAALHMLAEALFWFHPLVWWLGARMIDERERACDEEVLQSGSGAQVYAESILKVCEFYLESPLTCVSGITGSDLKNRIQSIMKEHFGVALSARKKFLLATAGVAALVVPLAVGVLRLQAQSAALDWQAAAGGKMAFDVASVKLNKSSERWVSNVPLTSDDAYAPTGGLFSATASLIGYMRFAFKDMKLAYEETPDLTATPAWLRTGSYDIEAKAQGNPTKDQMRLMMQSLLADRFKLAVHRETRQSPIYALVLSKSGKTGPQLKPDDGPCATAMTPDDVHGMNTGPALPPPSPSAGSRPLQIPCGAILQVPPNTPGHIRIAGTKVTMALLAKMAPNPVSGISRLVFDRTGLDGTFDVSIEWTPAITPPPDLAPGFTADQDGPTFSEALQDQLGLKLVPQTGPVDVLVIDHVEQPAPN